MVLLLLILFELSASAGVRKEQWAPLLCTEHRRAWHNQLASDLSS